MARAFVALALFALALFALALSPGLAAAEATFEHVVREGETLASVAERYYGDPRRESVLVAENGLTAQGGAPIVVGLRLRIPYVRYHRVAEGETWNELASRFYGDARRAFLLVEVNRGSSQEQPDTGAELLVPYPLRYVAGNTESITHVARDYFGERDASDNARVLRRFNNLRSRRISRGQMILIPLGDLVLSEEGRRLIEEESGDDPGGGEMRDRQAAIDAELPQLADFVEQGRYTESVMLGNRLLGSGVLTGSQLVTVYRRLAVAYVALGHVELAADAFRVALEHQPELELDSVRTSPRVREAFESAKRALQEARSAAEAQADEDAAAAAEPGSGDEAR